MANFAEVSSETAELLREASDKTKQGQSQLKSTDAQVAELSNTLKSDLQQAIEVAAGVLDGVRATRESLQRQFEQLHARIDSVTQQSTRMREDIASQVDQLRNKLESCQQAVTNTVEEKQQLVRELVISFDQTNEDLTEQRSDINRISTSVEQQLEKSQDQVAQQHGLLRNRLEEMASIVKSEMKPLAEETMADCVDKIDEIENQICELLTSSQTEFESEVGHELEELTTTVADLMARIGDIADQFAASSERIGSAVESSGASVQTTHEVMNVGVNTSTIGIRKVVGILLEIRQMMEEV